MISPPYAPISTPSSFQRPPDKVLATQDTVHIATLTTRYYEIMTSILTAYPLNLPANNIMAQIDPPATSQIDDKNRGRRRSRISMKPTEDEGELSHGELAEGHTSGDDGPSRKRRRSRKGLDKKFECSTSGCGKSYSRAEHL